MKNKNVSRIELALNLQHNIVGVKFLDFEQDYLHTNVALPDKKGPFCYHVRNAMDGLHYKLKECHVTCDYARYAIGLSKADDTILQGRSYEYSGLYESKSISHNIMDAMKYLSHTIYGLEIGPLKEMGDADIVIIADYAETVMRIMQGYAYKYGAPQNLSFYGNQAMCSDMISKPFSSNDINLSLMCKGTRKSGRFDKGEISVAFPIHMFDFIVEGIISTVNPVHTPEDKRRIFECMNDENDLGIEINPSYNYGIGLVDYDTQIKEYRDKLNLNKHHNC